MKNKHIEIYKLEPLSVHEIDKSIEERVKHLAVSDITDNNIKLISDITRSLVSEISKCTTTLNKGLGLKSISGRYGYNPGNPGHAHIDNVAIETILNEAKCFLEFYGISKNNIRCLTDDEINHSITAAEMHAISTSRYEEITRRFPGFYGLITGSFAQIARYFTDVVIDIDQSDVIGILADGGEINFSIYDIVYDDIDKMLQIKLMYRDHSANAESIINRFVVDYYIDNHGNERKGIKEFGVTVGIPLSALFVHETITDNTITVNLDIYRSYLLKQVTEDCCIAAKLRSYLGIN